MTSQALFSKEGDPQFIPEGVAHHEVACHIGGLEPGSTMSAMHSHVAIPQSEPLLPLLPVELPVVLSVVVVLLLVLPLVPSVVVVVLLLVLPLVPPPVAR